MKHCEKIPSLFNERATVWSFFLQCYYRYYWKITLLWYFCYV